MKKTNILPLCAVFSALFWLAVIIACVHSCQPAKAAQTNITLITNLVPVVSSVTTITRTIYVTNEDSGGKDAR